MKTDFTDYKFRCSSLGKLMVGVKPNLSEKQQAELIRLSTKQSDGSITEKQTITLGDLIKKRDAKPELSATTISYLRELHVQEVFGKTTEIKSKYLDKGIQVEEQSLTMYSNMIGKPFYKHKERKDDDFITGEPDNAKGIIRDIKSSWDISTFPMYEDGIKNQVYYWQLQGYMELFDVDDAELIYCLVDTPDLLIEDEQRRMSWKLGFIDLPENLANEIERNMRFSDVPDELRCRVFPLKRDKKAMKQLQEQIKLCREYMNSLSEILGGRIINAEKAA